MLILLFIVSGALFLMSGHDLVSIFLSIELQSYALYLLCAIYKDSELATTGALIWATVRVHLKLLTKYPLNSSGKRTKDHRPYPESATTGGQQPGLEGIMRQLVAMDTVQDTNRNLKVNDVTRIRLICQRLSNFGLGTIFSREQHLLEFFTTREAVYNLLGPFSR